MKRCLLFFCLAIASFSFAEESSTLLDVLTKPDGKGEAAAGTASENADAGIKPADLGGADIETEGDEFDEAAFWENYEGPNVQVIYDERSEIDYVIVQTEDEYTEFHYLDHIGYSDLIFVLTDLLKRITTEGYIHASNIGTEYKKNDEVALIYKIDKKENIAYGIVQFPDFSVFVRAKKEASPGYPFNVSSPNHIMALVYQFTMALAEVEQLLGVNHMEYTKKFFKKE
ncbi:MAG: hypothetical protein LBB22_04275 [Treponema sp.]|jgi:hypothetical protein|nr:hypothetical protein [Treponema sp.]